MRSLGGLESGAHINLDTLGRLDQRFLLKVSFLGRFLSDEAVPSGTLVRLNKELTVEVVHCGGILIKRVTVDIELNLLEQTLTRVVAVTENILVRCSSNRSVSSLIKFDVKSHIIEER